VDSLAASIFYTPPVREERLATTHPAGHNEDMPKRSSNKKPAVPSLPSKDETAEQSAATEQPVVASAGTSGGKNAAAVALGRLGGKKGGPARAAKLSKERRREIARKAAQARWANQKGQ
jgi:hypothetical protein